MAWWVTSVGASRERSVHHRHPLERSNRSCPWLAEAEYLPMSIRTHILIKVDKGYLQRRSHRRHGVGSMRRLPGTNGRDEKLARP